MGSANGKLNGTGTRILNLLAGAGDAQPEEDHVQGFGEIESELKLFEEQERERLGIAEDAPDHWFDPNPQRFTLSDRAHTTILSSGLTMAQDELICSALEGLGYNMQPLDVPDYESLRFGKEFGNRGQCNPTYFTVGNLVKYLTKLRDEHGVSTEEIVEKYIYFTAGSCGPCRFGTYTTEFRKALREAGFDGFRVMLFQQQSGLKQATGEASGLELNPKFFLAMVTGLMIGDALNAIGYRMRPYEVNKGDTDEALEACKADLKETFRKRKSTFMALRRCKKILKAVPINRVQPKPKVSIIGEFWAMTTEGDGNYKLQRFLEEEGAEVDIQLVTAWLLYNVWQVRFDTLRRMELPADDQAKTGLKGVNPRKRLAMLWLADKVLKGAFTYFSRMLGLNNYHLPDMGEIATISHQHYDNHLRGGEGHMEVGKLIQTAVKKKAHMVISVKPFGCMPSSGVSDGIQSLISTRYPEAIFCAIETTGDGAVNVQSRVQMDLFKARQKATDEFDGLLEKAGLSQQEALDKVGRSGRDHALYYPAHNKGVAGTGANHLVELMKN